MGSKVITIQTNTPKKGKLDQRSFTCQVLDFDDHRRIYVLDDTRRELSLKRFDLIKGCRIFDDGICYPIHGIWYSPKPKHPHLIVLQELTV